MATTSSNQGAREVYGAIAWSPAGTFKQLGQARPADTNAVSIYSPPANNTSIITTINVANTTAIDATYRLFHDSNGTTYDETTALAFDVTVSANTVQVHDYIIGMNDTTGNLAVRTGTANAVTFTVYGQEIT